MRRAAARSPFLSANAVYSRRSQKRKARVTRAARSEAPLRGTRARGLLAPNFLTSLTEGFADYALASLAHRGARRPNRHRQDTARGGGAHILRRVRIPRVVALLVALAALSVVC